MSQAGFDIEIFNKEELIDYLLSRYAKRYPETLTPSRVNVARALYTYSVAWNEGLGITQAVERVYGYRYRRMENFIRELGLWGIVREGWLSPIIILKVYTKYVTYTRYRCDVFKLDSEVEIPVSITSCYLTDDFFDYLLGETVEETQILSRFITTQLIENLSVGYDFKHSFTYMYTDVTRYLEIKYIVYKQRARTCSTALESEPEKITEGKLEIAYKPMEDCKTYISEWEVYP